MPPVAYRYAVPDGVVRAAPRPPLRVPRHQPPLRERPGRRAARPAARRRCAMVTLHLGNGCSAAAVRDGESVDTTMGLTPLEGLVMGTRSGDVDPGAARLRRRAARPRPARRARRAQHPQRAARPVRHRATTCARSATRPAGARPTAALAIEVFCYRAAKAVGALAVALGRLDAVVFTGGIGEHDAAVRARGPRASLGVLGAARGRRRPTSTTGARTGGRVSSRGRRGRRPRRARPTRSWSSPATPRRAGRRVTRTLLVVPPATGSG